jgi:tetratricopeptide (TPR) repeat protein
VPTHRLLYQLAVLRGDADAAKRQLDWARGHSREFDVVAAEAQVAAYQGRLRRASELYRSSVVLAESRGLPETGLSYAAHEALTLVLYGESRAALACVREALARQKQGRIPADAVPRVRLLTTLGLLGAPDAASRAESLAEQQPQSTLVNGVVLPSARAAIALEQGRPEQALEALRGAAAYETGIVAVLIPVHLRAEAYLRLGDGTRALEDFRKILTQRGADPFSPVCALATLGVARALRALDQREQAAMAYRDFFEAWRDADAELPVLAQARTEYARLAVR